MASVTRVEQDGHYLRVGTFDENSETFYDVSGSTRVTAVPSGATYSWDVDATAEMTLSATTLALGTNGLTLTGNIDLGSAGTLINVGAAGNDWTTNALSLVSSNSAATNLLTVENSESTNGASDAQINITSGGASGGDPAIKFLVTGAGVITMGLDNSDTDAFVWSNNAALGTTNRMALVIATGILSVDGDGGGSDDPVSLFDDYDDALELQRFAYSHPGAEPMGLVTPERREQNRARMVELGVAEWFTQEEGPDHLAYRIQPMLRMLAGGIYQTRQRLDAAMQGFASRLAAVEQGQLASG